MLKLCISFCAYKTGFRGETRYVWACHYSYYTDNPAGKAGQKTDAYVYLLSN